MKSETSSESSEKSVLMMRKLGEGGYGTGFVPRVSRVILKRFEEMRDVRIMEPISPVPWFIFFSLMNDDTV